MRIPRRMLVTVVLFAAVGYGVWASPAHDVFDDAMDKVSLDQPKKASDSGKLDLQGPTARQTDSALGGVATLMGMFVAALLLVWGIIWLGARV